MQSAEGASRVCSAARLWEGPLTAPNGQGTLQKGVLCVSLLLGGPGIVIRWWCE